jgi:hypothetical protein
MLRLWYFFLILLLPILSAAANEYCYTRNPELPLQDFGAMVKVVGAREYYPAEFARISSGCWTLDVWNTPTLGHREFENGAGNMRFFNCGEDSTFHPLFESSLIVGWSNGVDTLCYSDMMGPGFNAGFKATDSLTITLVENRNREPSYYEIKSSWCTSDSLLSGEVIYSIHVSPDTSVILQKVKIWSTFGSPLDNFLIGAGFDWNVTRESYLDNYGFLENYYKTAYQRGSNDYYNIISAAYPIHGIHFDGGACILPNEDYIDPSSGYDPKEIYGLMAGLGNQYISLADPGVNINTVHRFWKGTLYSDDTLSFCYIAGGSLTGEAGIMEIIDKAVAFSENHDICLGWITGWGNCGDVNNDTQVNVSDAVLIINYVFIGGPPPDPNIACGDVNEDHFVNVSDAVYLINFIFIGGSPPDACAPHYWDPPCFPYEGK